MTKTIQYSFHYVDQCNMCESPSKNHSILGRRLNTRQGLRPQQKVGIATTVMKCNQCGLVYANPTPIPKQMDDHYGVPPESYWRDDYFATNPNYLKGQIGQFQALYGRSIKGAGLKALDIGAGIGKGMIALSSSGFQVFGVEPSETFYRRAVGRMGVSENNLKLTTVEQAEFAESSFDFINMTAVVEHLYDPSMVVARALQWLKPGGFIHVEVPSASFLISKVVRSFYRLTGSDYVINLSPLHSPYHLYEFTPKSFQFHAKRNHYIIAHYEHYVCESSLPRLVRPLLNLTMKATGTGMQLAIWLRKPQN